MKDAILSYDMTIRLASTSSEAHVSIVGEDGTVEQKTISVDELIAQLTSSQRISTGILPRGTRFYRGHASDYFIAVELIPKKRKLLVTKADNKLEGKNVPVPRCLFVARILNKCLNRSWLFALKQPFSNMNDLIFSFPFGNVYEKGLICWGNAKIPPIKKPLDLVSVIATFFDSPFNGDLSESNYAFISPPIVPDEYEVVELRTLIKYLDGMDEFPENMLYEKHIRLETLIEQENH